MFYLNDIQTLIIVGDCHQTIADLQERVVDLCTYGD